MTRRIICLLIAAASVIGAVPLFAQEGAAAAAGTLTLEKKNYPLTHALAYETTINDEEVIAVVLSGQAVSSEKLKEARKRKRRAGTPISSGLSSSSSLRRQESSNSGAPAREAPSLGRRSGDATGELKLQDGR